MKKKYLLAGGNSFGFSLIELVVVTGILILLTGGGIASLITFNEKQKVVSGGKELQSYLRSAQSLIRVREAPDGCAKLTGYRVISLDAGATKEIKVFAVCSGGDIEKNSYFLPESTSMSSDIDITFLGLHGGVVGATSIEVTGASDRTYSFEVTQGGEITQGELL